MQRMKVYAFARPHPFRPAALRFVSRSAIGANVMETDDVGSAKFERTEPILRAWLEQQSAAFRVAFNLRGYVVAEVTSPFPPGPGPTCSRPWPRRPRMTRAEAAKLGGIARARKLDAARRREIAAQGFAALVDRRFGGDRQRAIDWLTAKGLAALDEGIGFGRRVVFADPGPMPEAM